MVDRTKRPAVWGGGLVQEAEVRRRRGLDQPKPIRSWTLTTLREKLVKIGAKVVSHAKYRVFQLEEVAVPRQLFAALVARIGRLRLACASG
jgi:hypothetical protein